MTTVKQTVSTLEAAIAELEARAHRAAEQLERTTKRLEETEARLARGTGDHTHDLMVAEWSPVPTRVDAKRPVLPPVNLAADLERALRAAPLSISDAALALGVPVAHVSYLIRTLKSTGKVVNVGGAENPRWTWVLGDEASTPDLVAKVEQLLRLRPMTLNEMQAATGARRNRMSGALVQLRRLGIKIDNTGNGWRAIWSIAGK